MAEAILDLLKRTKSRLDQRSTELLGSRSNDPLVLDALESFARQLEDRADQCATWIYAIESLGDRMSKAREADMRDSCHEFLKLAR